MALPQAIQAQLDQANAILASANPPAPVPPPPPPEPPAPEPAPQPPPPAPPTAAPKDDEATWKQRYLTLQGIHRNLQGQAQTLQTELEAVRQAPAPSPTPAPTPAPAQADPREVEAFGLDMVQMVRRNVQELLTTARSEIAQQFATLVNRVEQLEGNVGHTAQAVARSAEDQFFDAVTKLVPNWQEINEQPGWLAFLNEVDPVYGVPRQAALDNARSRFNAKQAAAVFQAYIHTLPEPQAQAPQESPSPRTVGSSPAPAPTPHKRVYTQVEVAKILDDIRRRKYSPQDAQRLDAEITAAMAEGRIR